LDFVLSVDINICSRLINQNDPAFLKHGSCNAYELLLSCTQILAAFAYLLHRS
jgi:hypothetical protein